VLTKEQHIGFWKDSSAEDWETATILLQHNRFGFCLFSLHLVIEKLLKALWVKENVNNTPPFTHDLLKLAQECGLEITLEQEDFLVTVNSWNIRGRYPDYTKALHNSSTEVYVKKQIEAIQTLKQWLEKQL
jgi:HEPN domain-containing protein